MWTDYGFDDPELYEARRNTFCAVLSQVEQIIHIPENIELDLWVQASAENSDDWLAQASPLFDQQFGQSAGIYNGIMLNHITYGIEANSAQINWASVEGAQGYIAQTKPCSSAEWTSETEVINSTNHQLELLNCESCYNWRVRTSCEESIWSTEEQFTTQECPNTIESQTPCTFQVDYSNGTITVDKGNYTSPLNLFVFDASGRLMFSESISREREIGLSLSNGVYTMILFGESVHHAQRIWIYK